MAAAAPLTLITLAGEELPIVVDLNAHARLSRFRKRSANRAPLFGNRIVGEAAWRSCQRLQEVHLPDTVVSLRHGAFRRCPVLRTVIAPGCTQFGIQVFEACCSLTQIGATQHPDNLLAPQAQLRPRAFEGCTALRHLTLSHTGLARNRRVSSRWHPSMEGQITPLGTFLDARGAMITSPGGVMQQLRQQAFSVALSPPPHP